jgi:hypothetical protein
MLNKHIKTLLNLLISVAFAGISLGIIYIVMNHNLSIEEDIAFSVLALSSLIIAFFPEGTVKLLSS